MEVSGVSELVNRVSVPVNGASERSKCSGVSGASKWTYQATEWPVKNSIVCDWKGALNPMIWQYIWKPHSSPISLGLGHDKRLWAHFSTSRATYLRSMRPKIGLNRLILVCRSNVALTLMKVKHNKNQGTFRKQGRVQCGTKISFRFYHKSFVCSIADKNLLSVRLLKDF